jgi:hypothetical protein
MLQALIAILVAASPTAGAGGWRELQWGMSREQVSTAMNKMDGKTYPLEQKGEDAWAAYFRRDYSESIGGIDVSEIVFYFAQGELISISMQLAAGHTERAAVVRALMTKYGKPKNKTPSMWCLLAATDDKYPRYGVKTRDERVAERNYCWTDGPNLVAYRTVAGGASLQYESLAMEQRRKAEIEAKKNRPVDGKKL